MTHRRQDNSALRDTVPITVFRRGITRTRRTVFHWLGLHQWVPSLMFRAPRYCSWCGVVEGQEDPDDKFLLKILVLLSLCVVVSLGIFLQVSSIPSSPPGVPVVHQSVAPTP
jgi:hypothetical protein